MLAEIIGRTTGYNQGRGGTFHVIAKHLGILQTSAIVAGCIPLAVGAAFSIKRRGTNQVSLVFFGDGVLEEGAFHEGINMASLWKLPVVFMCENNSVPPEGRQQGEYPSSSLAATQLADVSRAMNIETHIVDGSDVRAVSSLVGGLVARTRAGEGPFFIESRLTRWPGNRGQFPALIGGPHQMEWTWNPESADPQLQDWLRSSDPVSPSLACVGQRRQDDKGRCGLVGRQGPQRCRRGQGVRPEQSPPQHLKVRWIRSSPRGGQ